MRLARSAGNNLAAAYALGYLACYSPRVANSLRQRLVQWTPFGTVRSHAAVVRAIELARRGAGRI